MTLVLAFLMTLPAVNGSGDEPLADPLCIHGGRNSAIWLIQVPNVSRELQLDERHLKKICQLREELEAEIRRLYAGLFGLQGPEHERLLTERRKRESTITREYNQRVIALLEPAQIQRLDQLYVQFLGPRALFEVNISARLDISEERQKELAESVRSEKISYSALLEMLTAEQRKKLATLQGEPFEFPRPQLLPLDQH